MDWTRQVIEYWRRSVLDGELLGMVREGGGLHTLGEDEIVNGYIEDGNLVVSLWNALIVESSAENAVELIIAPVAIQKPSAGLTFPIKLPAMMFDDGALAPHPHMLPWIPRPLLDPSPSPDATIGTQDDYDAFVSEQSGLLTSGSASWEDVVAWGWELLRHVAGERWRSDFLAEGWNLSQQGMVTGLVRPKQFSQNVLKIYDKLLELPEDTDPDDEEYEHDITDLIPGSLAAYVLPRNEPPQPPYSIAAWQEAAQWHLAHPSAEYALSPSQREALYHFLMLPEPSVLAVNGPPGTGKTTLLQSVVTTFWAQAAINDQPPPIIVVTSTNNQAVTNVIESFGSFEGVERWVDISSFGLYLVNSQKKKKAATERGFLVTDKQGKGVFSRLEQERVVMNSAENYLNQLNNHFQSDVSTLAEAKYLLETELDQTVALLQDGIAAAYALADSELSRSDNLDRVQQRLDEIEDEVVGLNNILDLWADTYQAWQKHLAGETAWQRRMGFLSNVIEQKRERNRGFVDRLLPDYAPRTVIDFNDDAIEAYIKGQLDAIRQEHRQLRQEHHQLRVRYFTPDDTQAAWDDWRALVGCPDFDVTTLLHEGDIQAQPFLDWLDRTLRFDLFELVTHLWECRWLIEMNTLRGKQGRDWESQLLRWRRYAMLTPCWVTTFQTGPSFFDYWDGEEAQPYFEAIDLLIVDEGGQVSPEISGAMVALAKQTLVVGDVKQIRPIHAIPTQQDRTNLQLYGLLQEDEDLDLPHVRALSASRGSAMALAQAVSPFQKTRRDGLLHDPGMFLREHRRCVPEIIAYCNELAYGGSLIPMRASLPDPVLPPFAFLRVGGRAEKMGGSRRNRVEAATIVQWLQLHQELLEHAYRRPLTDIVGIITPFVAQKNAINVALSQAQLRVAIVGTIHALQGGERPIILFSPTYSEKPRAGFFFDFSVNMLNVAVSRARDSFIVIGNIDLLRSAKRTPSGLLAEYLFRNGGNELTLD